jgi:protein ImuA
MNLALPQLTLDRLRQTLAGIDPSLGPGFAPEERPIGIAEPIDTALGGGLACGAVHELAAATPLHLGAASGFATALAARATLTHGEVLWIATDFAVAEGGVPYGPGLGLFGLCSARFLLLRVPKPVDVLWAMEEALRCRALACVIAELTGEDGIADLTATRRLALAAREGVSARNSGFGLLLRHKPYPAPSAAMTRWQVAGAVSEPDELGAPMGNMGRARFDLSLRKNRRGPAGRWIIEWDHHERAFQPALSVGVAAPALDRPDRETRVRTG